MVSWSGLQHCLIKLYKKGRYKVSKQRRRRKRKQLHGVRRIQAGANQRFIVGWNPIIEALQAEQRIEKIWIVQRDHSRRPYVQELAAQQRIPVQFVERDVLDASVDIQQHQGVVALAAAFSYKTIDEVLEKAKTLQQHPFLLLLDHVEDPQNVGSLIRTAECAGVHGVLLPKRRSASITPVVGKASAGAVEHMPVVQIGNVAQTIEQLKQSGMWVVGADMSGEKDLYESDLSGPIVLVIGSEGKGLSRLVTERCDF